MSFIGKVGNPHFTCYQKDSRIHICNYPACSAWIVKSRPGAAQDVDFRHFSVPSGVVEPPYLLDLTIQQEHLGSYPHFKFWHETGGIKT